MMAANGLRSRSELFQRVVSALVLAVIAVATTLWGGWPFALVWMVLALAVAHEWEMIVVPEHSPMATVAVGAVIGVVVLALLLGTPADRLPGMIGLAGLGAGAVVMFRNRAAPVKATWLCIGVVYALALVGGIVLLRGQSALGVVAVLFLFAVVWLTDIAAYFGGRKFGGPKFAPRISPKKTWSGVVCGMIAGILSSVLLLAVAGRFVPLTVSFPHWILAFILAASVVYGDLFESFLKRRFGVKDAGSLIPGHGGFLDRLDGFTAATVIAAMFGLARGGWSDAAGGLLRW